MAVRSLARQTLMKHPRGIIFDFDGVMVDTEWAIYQSWVRLFAAENQPLSVETYAVCVGADYGLWNPATHLEGLTGKRYDWESLHARRREEIHAHLSQHGLMAGVRELMDYCHAEGITMAVASSSTRHWVEGWLRRLNIYDEFCGVFTRTDGYPVKPDPALFLAAQNCLGLEKEACLIIEDSENGTIAAANAGIPCAAVPCRMTEHMDFSRAVSRFASLSELLDSLH